MGIIFPQGLGNYREILSNNNFFRICEAQEAFPFGKTDKIFNFFRNLLVIPIDGKGTKDYNLTYTLFLAFNQILFSVEKH